MTDFSENELRELHGEDYVARFSANQDSFRLERLLPLFQLQPDDRIADFACGSAMLMPYVAPRVRSYVGVDFSPEFIAAAQAHSQQADIGNASFYCEDINQFCDRRQQQFDAAFAMDFSEHVYDEDWQQILSSIRGSLKPGGRFYLHTPNATYVIEQLKTRGILRQLPEHIAVRSAEHNARLLRAAGFNNVEVAYLAHYEQRQAWLHSLRHLPLVGSLFQARLFISCTA